MLWEWLVLGAALLFLVAVASQLRSRYSIPPEYKAEAKEIIEHLERAEQEYMDYKRAQSDVYDTRVSNARALGDRFLQKWPRTGPEFRDELSETLVRFESLGRLSQSRSHRFNKWFEYLARGYKDSSDPLERSIFDNANRAWEEAIQDWEEARDKARGSLKRLKELYARL